MIKKFVFFLGLALFAFSLCGCKNKGDSSKPQIAVSSSYIAAVVRDICGNDTDVLLIAPPGMCPGHFDISPAQIETLADCKLLLVFDFQFSIANSLQRLQEAGLEIRAVRSPQGLCIPQNYMAVVRLTAGLLSDIYPENEAFYQRRALEIEDRIKDLSAMLRAKARFSRVCKRKAIVAAHQAFFADWLGVRVVSVFDDTDSQTASDINQTLAATEGQEISIIIANKQQGTAAAKALANRLNAAVVQWSNFPEFGNDENMPDFDKLVIDNLCSLLAVFDE